MLLLCPRWGHIQNNRDYQLLLELRAHSYIWLCINLKGMISTHSCYRLVMLTRVYSQTIFMVYVCVCIVWFSVLWGCRRLVKYKECVSFVFFVHRVRSLAANRLLPQTACFWDSLHCWRHHRLLHGGHRHQRSPVDAARQDWYQLGFLFCTYITQCLHCMFFFFPLLKFFDSSPSSINKRTHWGLLLGSA